MELVLPLSSFQKSPQNVYNYLDFPQIIVLLSTYFPGLSMHSHFQRKMGKSALSTTHRCSCTALSAGVGGGHSLLPVLV